MSFYIASLKNTTCHREHILFYGPNWTGYTVVIGDITGEYGEEMARRMNDGEDTIAVPAEIVRTLISPQPFIQSGQAFYDQAGPVVRNCRANWNVMLKARMSPVQGDIAQPKPKVFRGTARSIYPKVGQLNSTKGVI